jgi:hypothetical protein
MDADWACGYKEPACASRAGLEQFMRMFGVAVLAASLFTTSLFVTGALAEPLKPGYPAGVQAARSSGSNTALKIGAGALILAGVGILASRDSAIVANTLVIKSQGIVVSPTINVVVSTSTTSTGTSP